MYNEKISDSHLLLLTVGFLLITIAVITAHANPASSYELSIYHHTPLIFWIGMVTGLILSVIIAFLSLSQYIRIIALSLGGLSLTSVVLLPVIRSYYYVGEDDSLSHLGNVLDINAGAVSVLDQLYPLSYILSIAIYHISGIKIRRGLVFLLVVFVMIFMLFVPLAARLFANTKQVINVSVFSSLLLLPINHFTGHMHPHPTSYAVLFAPLLFYIFIMLMKDRNVYHVILAVTGMAGMILLHPQQAANILILFGTVSAAQLIVRVILRMQQSHQQIHPYVILMAIIFWLWTEGGEKVGGNISSPIARFLARSEREAGGNVRSAVPSLEAAGGSPEEVFIKLFAIGFIYCIFTSILMAASLTELIKGTPNRVYRYGKRIAFLSPSSNLIVVYLTVGFTMIVGLFFVYILANQSRQYFRHHSFMMVVITILGSLALAQLINIANEKLDEKTVTIGISALFIVFLILSIPIIHVSPYLYQESQHVPESQVKGYEAAFEHQDESVPFSQIRSNYGRYYDAIVGERREIPLNPAEQGSPPYHFSEQGNLRQHYQEQTYLAVTSRDRTRDRDLHEGIRYTREDYQHFDEGRGIDRVQDNGGFTLYKINPPSRE